MNGEELIRHFERAAEAPGGIAKLRQTILDLAVRGKLVPQDPNDEPACKLLERIQAEKQRLLEEGVIRKPKPLPPVDEDEVPFPLPAGWVVARMGSLAAKLGAGSTPLGGKSVYQEVGVPFIRSQNVYNDGLRLDDVALIPHAVHNRMRGTHVESNDILLNITGASIGRCALVPDDFDDGNVSQHVAIVRLYDSSIREFLHLSLISPHYQDLTMDVQVGVSRAGLSMQKLQMFPMVVPPLPEQDRIVKRVNELMGLCDRLEAAQLHREQTRGRMTQAAFWSLTSAIDHAQEAPNQYGEAARFVVSNVEPLTARPQQIAQWRQTILDLAVRGKLVPQDPNDEPACELLKRIQAEKQRLVDEGLIRKPKPLPPVDEDEVPFPLPVGWVWTRFGELLELNYGKSLPAGKRNQDGDVAVYGSNGIVGYHDESLVNKPAIIIGRKGSAGAVNLATGPSWTTDVAYYLIPPECFDIRYLTKLLDSLKLESLSKGVKPGLSRREAYTLPIAIPPLAEQERIVARTSELLSLCDELASSLTAGETGATRLLDALVYEVLGTVFPA